MGLCVNVVKKLKGFSLDVKWKIEDELAVLFGFSGSGKSLTLQIIAGLVKPDNGLIGINETVFFDSSHKIDRVPQERSLGYVFQDLALFPHMTVRQNILFGSKGLGEDEKKRRYRELTEAFYVDGLVDKRPSEISGGQRQRVAFARALMRRPDVLLLDEPFSALDTPLRIEMRSFLGDLRRTFPVPIVLVTHDAVEAASLADRIIVYSDGAVIQSGSVTDVFCSPSDERVRRLLHGQENFLANLCEKDPSKPK